MAKKNSKRKSRKPKRPRGEIDDVMRVRLGHAGEDTIARVHESKTVIEKPEEKKQYDPANGMTVKNHPVFIRKLGEGGMGQVWLMVDRTIHNGKVVGEKYKAWKFINEGGTSSDIVKEAKAVAGFHHDNIVSITDPLRYVSFNQFPETIQRSFLKSYKGSREELERSTIPVMSMEYVEGFKFSKRSSKNVDGLNLRDVSYSNDLGKWFDRLHGWKSPYTSDDVHLMPLHTLWFVISRALRGLQYMNSKNQIHRDIKPENILIDSEGAVKITDFALVTDLNHEAKGKIAGTLSYMSPEQLMGEDNLDSKTDVFSLGIVAYQGMTGGVPHHIMTPIEKKDTIQSLIDKYYGNCKDGFPEIYRDLEDVPRNFNRTVDGNSMNYEIWLRNSFSKLLKSMLAFHPIDRPTPAEAVQELESILYNDGLPCPGPTHPALQTIGRLYTHDELQISEITRDPGIYNLLHLCTDPKTTKEKLDAGGNLDSSEYPIIARGVKSSSTHRHVEDSVIDLINNTREIHGSMEDQGYLDIPLIDF